MSFPTYGHAIHRSLQCKHPNLTLKLGQIHQLLAAALGHNSLASYQSAIPQEDLGEKIVVDRERLLERMRAFELPASLVAEFIEHLRSIATQVVYDQQSDYVEALLKYVREAAPNLPDVKSYLARTGTRIASFEVEHATFFEPTQFISLHKEIHLVFANVVLITQTGHLLDSAPVYFDGCIWWKFSGRRCIGTINLSGNLQDEDDLINQRTEYDYLSYDA